MPPPAPTSARASSTSSTATSTLPPSPPAELLDQFAEPELKDLARSLWDGLAGVRTFGSLLHPERTVNEAFAKIRARDRDGLWAKDDAEWAKRRRHFISELRKAFNREAGEPDLGRHLFGAEAGRGLDLLQVLGRHYDVVVTNPPYARRGNVRPGTQDLRWTRLSEVGKRDLYAAFILRCREFARDGGYVGMVTQQSWMFLTSLLRPSTSCCWRVQFSRSPSSERSAFEEIGGEVVSVAALRAARASRHHWRDRARRLVGLPSPAKAAKRLCAIEAPSLHVRAGEPSLASQALRSSSGCVHVLALLLMSPHLFE